MDEASVQYESTRYYSTLRPIFFFGLIAFGYHTAWLIILIVKKRRSGNTSNKYYATLKMF